MYSIHYIFDQYTRRLLYNTTISILLHSYFIYDREKIIFIEVNRKSSFLDTFSSSQYPWPLQNLTKQSELLKYSQINSQIVTFCNLTSYKHYWQLWKDLSAWFPLASDLGDNLLILDSKYVFFPILITKLLILSNNIL